MKIQVIINAIMDRSGLHNAFAFGVISMGSPVMIKVSKQNVDFFTMVGTIS